MSQVTVDSYEYDKLKKDAEYGNGIRRWVWLVVKILAGTVLFFVGISLMFSLVSPKLNLYRAQTERQAVIAEQKANSEAAEFAAVSAVTQAQALADAEVIRATGLAEAQAIIAETLTDEYVRYLYIQAIEGNPNQIIYVPTEAGLPILEAGRTPVTPTPVP
jgi:hypothetical protein